MGPARLGGRIAVSAVMVGACLATVTLPAAAGDGHGKPKPPQPGKNPAGPVAQAVGSAPFASAELQSQTVGQAGCGTNVAGEPAIHVSKDNRVILGSENGLGGGSELWRGVQVGGSTAADPCGLTYAGQPNAVAGLGASGGDIDIAIAPTVDPATGTYRIYVASLNLGSVNVATSTDNGQTFSQTPVQVGLPLDDREWIAAAGPSTALLTYHDIATDEIDVLRSDNGGQSFAEISQAIDPASPAATDNQHGNLVIDHDTTAGVSAGPSGQTGFWAYQSYVGPTSLSDGNLDEAYVAVSNDGGYSWTDQPVPCSLSPGKDLDHNFPNLSVAPDGTLYYAWSDDSNVYTARSSDHGQTWSCFGPVSTNTVQAIFPWLAATNSGVDLVYYGTPDPAPQGSSGTPQTWYVYFVQDTGAGFGAPIQVVSVHQGVVCESGATCNNGRQLFDDFGVDTDQSGWAHIGYSHDAPDLGGSNTYTGYAVQTAGTPVGPPN